MPPRTGYPPGSPGIPAQVATPTVPVGAIGSTIADESSGKVRQFFGNPANLATLLVGASALAGPGRGDESDLSRALRAGVGSLAFRGSLDREIEDQRTREEEAASVVSGREAQAEAAQGQIAATNRRTAATEEQTRSSAATSAAQITSAEGISEDRLSTEERIANQTAWTTMLNGALKSYSDAMMNWQLTGGPASGVPAPNFQDYQAAAMQSATMMGLVPDENIAEFFPDVTSPETLVAPPGGPEIPPPPTSDTVPPPVTTPQTQREQNLSRVVPASNRRLAGSLTDEALAQSVGSNIRRRLPEVYGELDDTQIMALVQQTNLSVEQRLPTMTPELARQILEDPTQRHLLSQDTIVALRGHLAAAPRRPSSGRNF